MRIIERAGLAEYFEHISELNDVVIGAQIAVDRAERHRVLDLVPVHFEEQIRLAQSRARRAGERLDGILAGLGESAEWREAARRSRENPGVFLQALDEIRSTLVVGLASADEVPPADVPELLDLYDRVVDSFRVGGLDGLVASLRERVVAIPRVLTEENQWGRLPQSPITFWELIQFILYFGGAAVAAVFCYIFSGCSWLLATYRAVCGFVNRGVLPAPAVVQGVCRAIAG